MQPEMVMFVGYPGAGKSYHIRSMYGSNPDFFIVEQDDIWEAVPSLSPDEAKQVAAWIATQYLQHGVSLVLGATGSNYGPCAKWFKDAKAAGYVTTLVNVTCSPGVAWSRNCSRERTLPLHLWRGRARKIVVNVPRLKELADTVIEIDNEPDTHLNTAADREPSDNSQSLPPVYDGQHTAHHESRTEEVVGGQER